MKYSISFVPILLLIIGCAPQNNRIAPKADQTLPASAIEKNTAKETISKKIPPRPKKTIQLKKVEDDNFSPEYMYPEDREKRTESIASAQQETPTPPEAPGPIITKEECIDIIGQEKFDKYTSLLGSEEASLKRCEIIKKVQQ